MKATLEYTLPDEREEHRLATVSGEMAADLLRADEQLRAWLKHGHDFANADEALMSARSMLADAVALARGE